MFIYEKKLQYPVDIKKKDLKMAKYLMSQYGGPDSELAACLRYLNQRYTMPDEKGKALLTDIATEELAHLEMISAMIFQLMKGATIDEIKAAGLGGHFSMHDSALFLNDPNGVPFTTAYIEASGDHIADLESNMAAEQRARATYEHLMDLTNDPDVLKPLSFLRQREVVHYQRFKELRNYYLKNQIN
ncbi:MAG: manganese catalase family protein [Lactobacillales bacterium]|nr:manganese catalase family protein [Lactobacillales bacterium]